MVTSQVLAANLVLTLSGNWGQGQVVGDNTLRDGRGVGFFVLVVKGVPLLMHLTDGPPT